MSQAKAQLSGSHYLLRWDHSRRMDVRRAVVVTPHRIADLGLENDGSLVSLLDRYPRKAISIYTMGSVPNYPNELRLGDIGRLGGNSLVRAIHGGRLALTLRDVQQHSEVYQELVHRLVCEITECHVGLRIDEPTADLMMASETTIEYLQCAPGQLIDWQLRGERTVWSYQGAGVLDDACQQHCVMADSAKLLHFDPTKEPTAAKATLFPGQMQSLPFLTPYRSECVTGTSVWLRLRYQTEQTRRQRAVYQTNAHLSRFLPTSLCGPSTIGPWATAKQLLATKLGKKAADVDLARYPLPSEPTFVVDTNSPNSVAEAPVDESETHDTQPVLNSPIRYCGGLGEDIDSTSAVLENK